MSGAIQAIGAIGNIAQGVYNAVSQYNQNLDNRAMVAEQNKFNLDQWYRENAYNHPVNVVQRLRAAGLNPALMYEGGAGNLQSAPSPQMQSSKDIAPMMTGMPTMAEIAQSSLVDSQAELNRANAAEIRSRIPVNEQQVNLLIEKCDEVRKNILLLQQSALAKHEEFNKLLNENNFFVETWANRSDLIGVDAAKARLELKTWWPTYNKNMEHMNAVIHNLSTNSSLNEAQKSQLESLAESINYQTKMLKTQYELLEKHGNAQQIVNMITQSVNSVSLLLNSILKIPGLGSIKSQSSGPVINPNTGDVSW